MKRCPICAEYFDSSHPNQKFCSRGCCKAYHNGKKYIEMDTREQRLMKGVLYPNYEGREGEFA